MGHGRDRLHKSQDSVPVKVQQVGKAHEAEYVPYYNTAVYQEAWTLHEEEVAGGNHMDSV